MTRRILAVLPLVLLAAGCTTRFTDDFEADTAGALPQVQPAGTPDDRIQVLDVNGNTVVTSTNPIDGTKSLRIGGASSSSRPIVVMYAEALTDTAEPVFAAWSGRLTSGAGARIFFFTERFRSIVDIQLGGGTIRVNGRRVGTYRANEEHVIMLRATPSDDSFGFSFFAPSGNHSTSGTVLNSSIFPSSNIGLQVQLPTGGASESYTMDSIVMSERRPPDMGRS